jgi:hypothetical protein
MLVRYGCGCIYLPTKFDADDDHRPTHGRLIDYCGGSAYEDDPNPRLGKEVLITDVINPGNLVGRYVEPEVEEKFFEKLAQLINRGRMYEEFARFMQRMQNEDFRQ